MPPGHQRTSADYIRLLGLTTGATALGFLIIWLLLDAIWELVVPFYAIFSAFYLGTLWSRPKIIWNPHIFAVATLGDLLLTIIGVYFDSFKSVLLLSALFVGAVAYLLPKERQQFKEIAFLGAALLLCRLLAVRGFGVFPKRFRPFPAYLASYFGFRLGLNCTTTAVSNRANFEFFLPPNMKKAASSSGPPPTSHRHSAELGSGMQPRPNRSRRVSLPAASFYSHDTRTQVIIG